MNSDVHIFGRRWPFFVAEDEVYLSQINDRGSQACVDTEEAKGNRREWESRGIKVIIETERDQGPRHPSETRNKGLSYVFTLIFPISEVPLL
jgi:hypothetical protein